MKISHVWKRDSTKKKNRPAYKIRWELMGLSHPDKVETTASMDTIRQKVSLLASQGLSERTPSVEQQAKGRGQKRSMSGRPIKRRGATE